MMHLAAPRLEPFCSLQVQVGAPISVGNTSAGLRRIVPILGGTVQGQGDYTGFSGKVIEGGTDYQIHHAEPGETTPTVAHLDARYTLSLLDGSAVYVRNIALRVANAEFAEQLMRGEAVDGSKVYFRCQPQFEVASPNWKWLMRHQFVGTGRRLPSEVLLSFFIVR